MGFVSGFGVGGFEVGNPGKIDTIFTIFSIPEIVSFIDVNKSRCHTSCTVSNEAAKRIHKETAGQTWLVNRLGTMLTVDIKPATTDPIDEKDVRAAIELLLKERNAHFDNLYEKAKLYKETFVKIVFHHTEYDPNDPDLTWLEQYGLIKRVNGNAVVANPIYKARFIKTFFKEVNAYEDKPPKEYELPGNRLDMERIILDFDQYIAQIGVSAFYQKWAAPQDKPADKEKKPYEKTGQFLLTAWLYQFVKGGRGELRYEVVSGQGRMDVLLTYKGRKYIIETKLNRRNLSRTLKDGITQVSSKYLATEAANEGYLVIFDAKSPVGEDCEPEYHNAGKIKITSFTIAIGSTP